ncbi:toll/interleukin-1 receptor domain-containing protein [Amycolatopsis sp. NPDC024027]|uniref:toll/interleukin-1 receptor domain-containing protein n=1 Tax=Amycolatopsis sp. NPDC024027 TaxID=3154327 RepID=UPI0033C83F6B
MIFENEQRNEPTERYDVFLSFTGQDRKLAQRLAGELHHLGLRVFVDDMIDEFESIDKRIASALSAAKTLVAIYSREFASRPACQRELMAAFIAAQQSGSPSDRILVVNPEPSADHLQPIELADAKYAVPPGDASTARTLAKKIRAKVRAVDTTLGIPVPPKAPPWIGAIPGRHRFVGRYPELWALHSALHRPGYALAHTALSGPVAALCGLPGAGKTALAAAYAWSFGNAYPAGVFWHRAGEQPTRGSGPYSESLRSAAVAAGLRRPGRRSRPSDLVIALGGALRQRGRPLLWVIDEIPETFDPADLPRVVPPVGQLLHTILISRENIFDCGTPALELGALPTPDAIALIRAYRPLAEEGELRAAGQLAERLGGHCGALSTAGEQLRDAQGFISVAQYEAAVGDGSVRAEAAVGPVLNRLTEDEKSIIRLAAVSGSLTLPAELIAAVIGSTWRTAEALGGIRRRLLATRRENWWSFHPLVVTAVARTSEADDAVITTCFVTELLRLAGTPTASATMLDGIRAMASRVLVSRPDLPLSDERRLRSLLAEPASAQESPDDSDRPISSGVAQSRGIASSPPVRTTPNVPMSQE